MWRYGIIIRRPPAQQATFVTTLLSPVAMRAWRVTSTCKATVARGSPMVEKSSSLALVFTTKPKPYVLLLPSPSSVPVRTYRMPLCITDLHYKMLLHDITVFVHAQVLPLSGAP